MALSVKRDDLKHVPWFSMAEWYDVYNQIYSNNHEEQEKAYETLLVWKARNPKLPVGVDCTLSLIQVSLRDREWSEKLDKAELPIHYENDLCMMYSLSIMRFLNHISNIGHMKQTSLFQIAKQLNIPEWIVNLRHDAAHGHELPSIGVLRIAVNILLTWLHDEYWTVEIKNMIDYFNKKDELPDNNDSEEIQALDDLIELWTATGLYIYANYSLVSDLPDQELRETLQELRTFTLQQQKNNENSENITENLENKKEFKLITGQRILLTEISACLNKSFLLDNCETICSVLCDNEVFIPNAEFLQLFNEQNSKSNDNFPHAFIKFWEGFILLLQEKKLIELLFLQLLQLVNNENEKKHKRRVASQWLCAIANALRIHKISQQMRLEEDQYYDCKNKKLSFKHFSLKLRNNVENMFSNLKFPWLNCTIDVSFARINQNFVQQLFLNPNEFTPIFMPSLMELVMPKNCVTLQKHLLSLLNIQTMNFHDENVSNIEDNTIYTVENLNELIDQQNEKENSQNNIESVMNFSDQTIRNTNWKLDSEKENWSLCPFGLLPWQLDREENVKSLIMNPSKIFIESETTKILPGMIDRKNFQMKSKIDWNNVLKDKKVNNKNRKRHSDILIDRAIKVIKKQL
ncbi:ribosomal biogenesis protein LAS1L [Leptopilina boulardi]|uniref:ribosomal biogenesis protein LAS1L n=1 Tax=Leptopilina boulardi TaxID=63433 RepID=UPI0021F563B1|nr:ribosomal biogenesis protein LAS1L [Leptopilina boulardi]